MKPFQRVKSRRGSAGQQGRRVVLNMLVIGAALVVNISLFVPRMIHSSEWDDDKPLFELDVEAVAAPVSPPDSHGDTAVERDETSIMPLTLTMTRTPARLHTPRQHDPTKPRLEFLHIQKNAGTYFEKLALDHGLPWGACHFDFPWKKNEKNVLRNCPPIRDAPSQQGTDVYWHYPLQYIPQLRGPSGNIHNPYDNNDDLLYAARPKKYFAVVRNPYTRIVSLYNHNVWDKHKSIEHLNEWVQALLRSDDYSGNNRTFTTGGYKISLYDVGLRYSNATICQYPYFYDDDGNNTMVDHIIHFESLKEDFDQLIHEYDLPSTFAPEKVEKVNASLRQRKVGVVTYKDLDNVTVKMMNQLCEKDFDLGRKYSKIEV
mmetsp:Transcript_8874/g.12645  ORF Transcript_8874/g.12645 Transcript_8874/m.12645 type:complete len:373 (-) Transcript_8874:922-2040(-)